LFVAHSLDPNGDTATQERITLIHSKGKPRISKTVYVYKETAPFKLAMVDDGRPYMPSGKLADTFLLR
jgi:hypothetical protein